MRRACVYLKSFLCRSFVAEILQKCPDSSVVDILFFWHRKQHLATGVSVVKGITESLSRAVSEYDVAEVQLLNKLYEEPMSPQNNIHLRHYSTAHFAAELGSTFLLEILFSQGVVLHDHAFESLEKPYGETFFRRRVSLENVARFLPDIDGYYLSHIAARNGHVKFLQCLVEHLGAETVLEQRTIVTGQRKGVRAALSVYGVAFVYGHELILNWVDTLHPAYGLALFGEHALYCVQRASAHTQVASLAYFARLHGDSSYVILREALYPAAEAGAEDVLEFLVDTLGADCVWWPTETGATALHYAARLGRTALLVGFFQRHNVFQHVDDADNYGRTPAMWCVMSGRKKENVEFLQLLLRLGSRWLTTVDNDGFSVQSLARLYYSPRSKMRKFIASCIASADK